MRSWVLLVVAACGSKQPAPPVVANRPPPAAPVQVATCKDVGVILRGTIDSGQAVAGPAREQAIEKACREEKWPQAVIDCVAGTATPQDCLDKLDEESRVAYNERIEAWNGEYAQDEQGMAGSHQMQMRIECADILSDVAKYPPALDDKAIEREWQTKQRAALLDEACEHDWSEDLKACISTAPDDKDVIDACFAAHLEDDLRAELVKALGNVTALAKKIEAAKKKPTSIGCKQVVAAHYADAKWKQKLEGYKTAERKKMIASSRTEMTKACTADQWDDTVRACLVSGGSDTCFHDANKRKWGYPATGAVTAVGIAECDAYSAKVLEFASCTTVAQLTRDSIVRSQQQMLAEIARMPQSDRAKVGTSCKAAMEAIKSSLSAAGC